MGQCPPDRNPEFPAIFHAVIKVYQLLLHLAQTGVGNEAQRDQQLSIVIQLSGCLFQRAADQLYPSCDPDQH